MSEHAFMLRWGMVLGADGLLVLYAFYLRWKIKRLHAAQKVAQKKGETE